MTADQQLLQHLAWLDCAAATAAAGKRAALPLYGTSCGRVGLGRGAGGDETLEIDLACERAMRAALAEWAPAPYVLVSEEAGIVTPPGARPEDCPWRVVMDPVDGSLNAKRGLETFGASIAIAGKGDTLRDVAVAYIEDYTRPRAFAAVKGRGLLRAQPLGGAAPGPGTAPGAGATYGDGATHGDGAAPAAAPNGTVATATPGPGAGSPLVPREPHVWEAADLDGARFRSDLVEVVLLEAGRPDRHHFAYHDLSAMGAVGRSKDLRIRQIGSLALSLCYVAVGVADILVAAVRSRSVDIAAGLMILAEAGGGVTALTEDDLLDQSLDLEKRCGFVAWRAGLDRDEIVARTRALGRALMAASD
jgi:fructose-1,6-bisphosphatase/inositol monophosphatase family enzyme